MLIFTAATEIRWWVRSSWSPANCRKYCLVEILLMASVKIQSGAFLPYMGIGQWSQYEPTEHGSRLVYNFQFYMASFKERKYCYKLKLKWGVLRSTLGQCWPDRSPAPDQTPGTQLVTSSPHTGRLPILITIQHIQIQALIHDTMWTVTQRKLFRTDKLNLLPCHSLYCQYGEFLCSQ